MIFSLPGIVVNSFNFDYFERSDNFRTLSKCFHSPFHFIFNFRKVSNLHKSKFLPDILVVGNFYS